MDMERGDSLMEKYSKDPGIMENWMVLENMFLKKNHIKEGSEITKSKEKERK